MTTSIHGGIWNFPRQLTVHHCHSMCAFIVIWFWICLANCHGHRVCKMCVDKLCKDAVSQTGIRCPYGDMDHVDCLTDFAVSQYEIMLEWKRLNGVMPHGL